MSQIIAVDVSKEKSFFVSVVRSIAAWLWKFGRCCFFHFVCAGLCVVIYTVFTPILHHIVSFIIIYLHAFNELLIKVKVNKKPFCCLPTEVTQKTQNKCIYQTFWHRLRPGDFSRTFYFSFISGVPFWFSFFSSSLHFDTLSLHLLLSPPLCLHSFSIAFVCPCVSQFIVVNRFLSFGQFGISLIECERLCACLVALSVCICILACWQWIFVIDI